MSSRAAEVIAVVTDSTAYLPDGVADKHSIGVVPLHVVLGGRTGIEGVDVSPQQVAAALAERGTVVSTSRPTPGEFAAAYRASGAREVVSIHLSAELSGTADAARLGAQDVAAEGIAVTVVDSRNIVMGLGFAVIAAAEAAMSGDTAEQVAARATYVAAGTTTLFLVDTLEHLRQGGRIGAASALLGAALAVKPILHVKDGVIGPLEKVRTASKALARLTDLAVQAAGHWPVDLAVHHLAADDRAAQLAADLRARIPELQTLYLTEVGAVVGAHVGPGLLGVVVSRR